MLSASNQRISLTLRILKFLEEIFLIQKLNNPFGYIFLTAVAGIFGYLIATHIVIGLSLFGILFGLAIIIVCLSSTEAGLYINLIYSFFAFFINRLLFNGQLSVGIISDILILTTLFSFFVQKEGVRHSINEFVRTSVVTWIIIVYAYIAIELFNPYAHSFEGWYGAFRKSLSTLIILFVAYKSFDSYERIKRFIIVVFLLCSAVGFYGCFQQWHGYFGFEINPVLADPHAFGLLWQDGEFRKFSTFSDPSAYGILMASCAIFFLVIGIGQKKLQNKLIVFSGVIFMILGMVYSGTRTANAVLIVGLIMYILLSLHNKGTRIFAFIFGILFAAILYLPILPGNKVLFRFRSTFTPTKDESYKVRELNRASIQPYLLSHPIGGGFGTTGATGQKLNPGHPLADFQTDSGYLKKALEAGYIGFGLVLILYFTIVKYGVKNYFRCKDERVRVIYAASVSFLFAFYIAEFAQDAIGQITDIVIYYPIIAIMLKLHDFDKGKNRSLAEIEA
jgi:putative inorganic carbon (HCO3(-)) transporter